MKFSTPKRVIGGLACCLLPLAQVFAQASLPHYVYTRVAAVGDAVANRPGRIGKLNCPALNAAGQVAFRGNLASSLPLNTILRSDAGGTRVLLTGEDRIGDYTIDPFSDLACPSINEQGMVATSGLTYPGPPHVTILAAPQQSVVSREEGLASGVLPSLGAAGYTFYRVGTVIKNRRCPNVDCSAAYVVPGTGSTLFAEGNPVGTRDGDTVVFRARLAEGGDGLVLANRYSSLPPDVIFRTGQSVGGRVIAGFGDPVISAGGQWVAFLARLADGGRAIVKARPSGDAAQLVAFDRDAGPDSAYAELPGNPGISDNGTVVFYARVADPAGTHGLFTGAHPDTDAIVQEGRTLDGLGARVVTQVPDNPLRESIDSRGTVVFEASFSDSLHAVVRAALVDPVPDLIVGAHGPLPTPVPRLRSPLLYDGATGAFVKYFGPACHVLDMAYGPDGRFYYIDEPSRSGPGPCDTQTLVRRVDGVTGEYNPVDDEFADFVRYPAAPPFFPSGMAFGPDGNLYLTSGAFFTGLPGSVLKFAGPFSTQPGTYLGEFVAEGAGGLSGPTRLRFGGDGRLYVVSHDSDSVLMYNGSSGAFLGTYAGPDSGLDNPIDMVFGPDGDAYVLAKEGREVRRYGGPLSAAPGSARGVFATIAGVGQSLAFGPGDDLFVTTASAVYRFDGRSGAPKGVLAEVDVGGPMLFSTRPAAHPGLGDFNHDGCVDRADLGLLMGQIGRSVPDLHFDLTGDGRVNVADARKLVLLFSRPQGAACA